MFASTFARVVAALLLVGLLAVVGVGIYNAGVSEGLAEAARAAAASGEDPAVIVPPYVGGYGGYGHGWGAGFGFFGFLFAILFVFLLFGLIRAAFGWGRWGGPRGPGGSGWEDERRRRLEELHRDLHRADQSGAGAGAGG